MSPEPVAQPESPVAVETVVDAPGLDVAAAPPSPEMQLETIVPPAPPAMSEIVAKIVPPPARTPAKAAPLPVAVEQPRKNVDPVAVEKAPEPALDVAGLTARLRDTRGIGVLTKLALKIQMDDLLKKFRAHHQGGQKTSVGTLRPPYDMLILKVLALLQESDPTLARAISGSREAIWGILADPVKFNASPD